MKKLKVELVEDWREAHKWSSMRFAAFLAFLLTIAPHVLQLVSDHWLEISPWVMHFFPSEQQSVVPVIGLILTIACRITKIRIGGEQ